jgi:urease alpha subunit
MDLVLQNVRLADGEGVIIADIGITDGGIVT